VEKGIDGDAGRVGVPEGGIIVPVRVRDGSNSYLHSAMLRRKSWIRNFTPSWSGIGNRY
jgi:hypothetical protein